MTAEVGSGQVAIFPTFRGFRSKTNAEMSGAGRDGGKTFNSAFNVGAGDPGQALIKKLNARIASGSKALSSARLAEQDAAGKVRVAETALAEARAKGGETSSRAVAAEERLATAQRKLVDAQTKTRQSTDQLKDSQAKLAEATGAAGNSGEQAGSRFVRGWQSMKPETLQAAPLRLQAKSPVVLSPQDSRVPWVPLLGSSPSTRSRTSSAARSKAPATLNSPPGLSSLSSRAAPRT